MSFTTDIKHEIANIEDGRHEFSELSALIKSTSNIVINNKGINLLIQSENATVSKRIFLLLKNNFEIETKLSIVKKQRLKKNNIYYIRVYNDVENILTKLGLYSVNGLRETPLSKIVNNENKMRAYLRGCFLAKGSINDPLKPNYHLEINALSLEHALFLIKILDKFNIEAKYILRRNNYIVYIKKADKIADYLKIIGAFDALLKFEDIRIGRDFNNSLRRLDNCEIANEVKILNAAKNQMDDILKIESKYNLNSLDPKILDIIMLRKEFPDSSLNELCDLYEKKTGMKMSKSGIKHRFDKIHQLASKVE